MTDIKETIQGLYALKTYLASKAIEETIEEHDLARESLIETQKVVDSAINLLKEQEHSETFIVIDNKTGEEADTYDIALHEDWAKHLCYCDMEGWAIEEDGTLLLVDECGRFEYADRERFKVKWE